MSYIVKTGTCSLQNDCPNWLERSGAFYPKSCKTSTDRLQHYARHFACVEVDTSSYAIPQKKIFKDWADLTPPGFVFHFKAFGLLTHMEIPPSMMPWQLRDKMPQLLKAMSHVKLSDLEPPLREELWSVWNQSLNYFYEKGKLGYVLFQFQPNIRREEEQLRYLWYCRERLDARYKMAVELRSLSWFDTPEALQSTLQWFRERQILLVCSDELLGGRDEQADAMASAHSLAVAADKDAAQATNATHVAAAGRSTTTSASASTAKEKDSGSLAIADDEQRELEAMREQERQQQSELADDKAATSARRTTSLIVNGGQLREDARPPKKVLLCEPTVRDALYVRIHRRHGEFRRLSPYEFQQWQAAISVAVEQMALIEPRAPLSSAVSSISSAPVAPHLQEPTVWFLWNTNWQYDPFHNMRDLAALFAEQRQPATPGAALRYFDWRAFQASAEKSNKKSIVGLFAGAAAKKPAAAAPTTNAESAKTAAAAGPPAEPAAAPAAAAASAVASAVSSSIAPSTAPALSADQAPVAEKACSAAVVIDCTSDSPVKRAPTTAADASNAAAVAHLVKMGFGESASRDALARVGGTDVERAVQQLLAATDGGGAQSAAAAPAKKRSQEGAGAQASSTPSKKTKPADGAGANGHSANVEPSPQKTMKAFFSKAK